MPSVDNIKIAFTENRLMFGAMLLVVALAAVSSQPGAEAVPGGTR